MKTTNLNNNRKLGNNNNKFNKLKMRFMRMISLKIMMIKEGTSNNRKYKINKKWSRMNKYLLKIISTKKSNMINKPKITTPTR